MTRLRGTHGRLAASARRARVLALVAASIAGAVVTARPAAAQEPTPPTLRGVPQGTLSPTPLPLTLKDAVERGLQQNLAAILEEQRLKGAESTRLEALSALLPHVSGSLRQSEQKISTASFGFQFPGVPTVIGPFDVFDARLTLSTPLFDARAIGGVRAGKALVKAGQADLRDVRETIVLAVGTLYLQVQADAARVESTRAEVTTAEALVGLANDQKAAGIVAGIDVLRQQVQLQSARARLITAGNVYEKRKLSLARAIGLPGGQAFTLASRTTFHAAPPLTLDQAVAEASAAREDVKAAQARVDAARYTREAEAAARWPSLHLDADLGTIGRDTSALDRTYGVAALVRVPVFEGGETRARVQRAQAELRIREAELADLTGSIRYDVSAALLDVRAADAGVEVADSARTLSQQELDQAQDRFKAGVASTLELVQAQESVATATEQYIESLYAHAVAKGTLTRALGQVESRFVALVGGEQ
jgi:outer membrane protein TolC